MGAYIVEHPKVNMASLLLSGAANEIFPVQGYLLSVITFSCTSHSRQCQQFKEKLRDFMRVIPHASCPFYSCIFDPKNTDCYAWGVSKNRYFLFGGAFEPQHAKQRFAALKNTMATYGFLLDDPVKTEACVVVRPELPTDIFCGENGVFFIGEAAGFISPSSLEGLSYAFDSARILAEILNSAQREPNRAYFLKTLPLRVKLLAKVGKCPFIFCPPIRKLVMLSGINSIPIQRRYE